MRATPRRVAVLMLTLALPIAAQTDDNLDGSGDFKAFIAESREKQSLTRVEELDLHKRQLDRRITAMGRTYVRLLRSGLLPLSDGVDEMLRHVGHVERLRQSLQRDLMRRTRIEREQQALEAGVQELRRRRALLAQNLEEYERSREAILAARDREAAFQRAFDKGNEPAEHSAIYAAPADAEPQVERFSDTRGRLRLPIAGRAEVRPVRLPDAIGPGVFLAVEGGARVSAVFPGKVVLTGDYGELGPSVVVDHGDGYSTLSAKLGRVLVEAGDTLQAGDVIGTLRDTADGNLYFEVRQEGAALDPAEWFGL